MRAYLRCHIPLSVMAALAGCQSVAPMQPTDHRVPQVKIDAASWTENSDPAVVDKLKAERTDYVREVLQQRESINDTNPSPLEANSPVTAAISDKRLDKQENGSLLQLASHETIADETIADETIADERIADETIADTVEDQQAAPSVTISSRRREDAIPALTSQPPVTPEPQSPSKHDGSILHGVRLKAILQAQGNQRLAMLEVSNQGSRIIRIGDEFHIPHEGKATHVKVIEIENNTICLLVDNQERMTVVQ